MTHATCRLTAKKRDQLHNPIRSVIEYGLPLVGVTSNTIISDSARKLTCTLFSIALNSRDFYRAMLCISGTSRGPVSVSVRPSVTSRSSTKMVKRRITQTTPHDSPETLVFWCQRSPRNSTGVTPCEVAECRWGGSKSAISTLWTYKNFATAR